MYLPMKSRGRWQSTQSADGVVARLLPGVVLRLHDVAVDADLRVRAHVRQALGVEEREAADTREHAEQDCEHGRAARAPFLSRCRPFCHLCNSSLMTVAPSCGEYTAHDRAPQDAGVSKLLERPDRPPTGDDGSPIPALSAGAALLLRRPFHEHPTMALKILNSVPPTWRAVLHLAKDAGAVRSGAR